MSATSSDYSSLTLLLPGALTRAPMAPELARRLEASNPPAPTLLNWFQHATAASEDFDPALAACSATEYWWLRRAGFPAGILSPGSGLASLLAPSPALASQAVWVAELAHIRIGRDGLVLTDPAELDLEEAESAALLEAARPLFEADNIGVEAVSAQRWRLDLPPGVTPYAATPAVVSGEALDYWWPRHDAARAWRRLSNEIQMSWHDHPVNAAREQAGKSVINGLWLHGGAPAWRASWPGGAPAAIASATPWVRTLAQRSGIATPALPGPQAFAPGAIIDLADLYIPARTENWAVWLDTLKRLETEWFAPLDQALRQGRIANLELVLPDTHRLVSLRLTPRPAWLRWLPQSKHDWKHWWLPPES